MLRISSAVIVHKPAKSSEPESMRSGTRVSPARAAAFDVLLRVETHDSYAAELLHSNLLVSLSAADRGLATELVMGVLRWQQKLDQVVGAAAGRSTTKLDLEVQLALRIGAYQLLYLDRIPARAAVNESVELVKLHGKRSAAPLVNAVLRKLSSESLGPFPPERPLDLGHAYSHPAWLVERWTKAYGTETARAICEHNQKRPETAIRANSRAVLDELLQQGITLEPAAFVAHAWRVKSGDVTETSAYRERRLAIQDEASQLIALLAAGETILDSCAAPGGKSAIAAERNPMALIVSMDLHLHRVRLMHKLTGTQTALVADARQLPFRETFDCVIADAPCTGTGTLARNPEIKWRLKPEDLPRLASLQSEILNSLAKQAKTIVYSTCSLEPEEGEEVISRFLAEHPNFRPSSVQQRLRTLLENRAVRPAALESLVKGDFLRTIPGIHPCDGFFAAILERDTRSSEHRPHN
jgi:16S rRNA (cytosine967-C5)-methyltransferase